MRKSYSEQFKFKVAVAALKNDATITEICRRYEVAESLVHKWKKQLLKNGAAVFMKELRKGNTEPAEKKISKLYEKIGQLTVERDFLKKIGNTGKIRAIKDAMAQCEAQYTPSMRLVNGESWRLLLLLARAR